MECTNMRGGSARIADARAVPAVVQEVLKTSFWELYREAVGTDRALLVVGTLTALCIGVTSPLMGIVLGDSIQSFRPNTPTSSVLDKVSTQSLLLAFIGLGLFACSIICEASWTALGERLSIKIRCLYLESIMRKEIAWFDTNHPQELPTKITLLISKYQNGVGDKMGKVFVSIAMSLCGLVLTFVYGWQLALVLIGVSPLFILAARLIAYANSRSSEDSKQAYAACGGYAEEALSAIKTVYAFCAADFEKSRYLGALGQAQKAHVQSAVINGLAVGCIHVAMSLGNGLGYLCGSFFVEYGVYSTLYNEPYTCATVMTVFFTGIFAMFSLGLLGPQLKEIDEARIAARDMYEIIDSVKASAAPVGPKDNLTIPPEQFRGRIEFKNVTFWYPSRPSEPALKDFSMVFEPGEFVGICGETGSGKSTIVQLIERFYDPCAGTIEVDGVNILRLDLKWWRGVLGYVGQEPVLFNTTIEENIRYGKDNVESSEIELAARRACCTEILSNLRARLKTNVGAEGGHLSGGEKQRIAIARALVRNPRILLLDEATSALDRVNEGRVQAEINELQRTQNLSAIIVAHRMRTIRLADKILVISKGQLTEMGTDKELRDRDERYADLCRLQEEDEVTSEDPQPVQPGQRRPIGARRRLSTRSLMYNEERRQKELAAEQAAAEEEARQMALNANRYKSHLLSESWKHRLPLLFAVIASFLAGYYFPVTGMLFGMISMDLLEPDRAVLRAKINMDFLGLVLTGVFMFFILLTVYWLFGTVAARVSQRLRELLYDHIMKMDIGWFDHPKNLPFILNGVLAEDTNKLTDFIRMSLGTLVQCVSTLLIGLAIAFGFQWRMALVVVGCVPIVGISGYVQAQFHVGVAKNTQELYKNAMGILAEAVKNFRTVASFGAEQRVLRLFQQALDAPKRSIRVTALLSGLIYGIGQLLPLLVIAGLFYFAALFVKLYDCTPRDTFIAVYTLLFAAMAIGQIGQSAPDMGKAYASLYSVYRILDQKPSVQSPEPGTESKQMIVGSIKFDNVSFKYPTREEFALKDFSMEIHAGEKVAIVGVSGSGKSTIIQLLERFYDVTSGTIYIDGVDIKHYSLTALRRAFALVPQEPVLFDTTLGENLKYGSPNITEEEMVGACEIAGALAFLEQHEEEAKSPRRKQPRIPGSGFGVGQGPGQVLATQENLIPATERRFLEKAQGLQRRVGPKGSGLSGGEKQRVAIARALLKNPRVLLFDEATSALDVETEVGVLEGLSEVSEGRTLITVAHRLSSVTKADRIFVVKNGSVVESGSRDYLERKQGAFCQLYGLYSGNVSTSGTSEPKPN